MKIIQHHESEFEIEVYCDICDNITSHLKSPAGDKQTCMNCGVDKLNFKYQ